MMTEKIVMLMAFGAIKEQTHKFVISLVLLENRRTSFTLLAITLAEKERRRIYIYIICIYIHIYKYIELAQNKKCLCTIDNCCQKTDK